MLGYNDLRIGIVFLLEGAPYEVQEFAFLRMQQRKAVAQVKMKNLINGKVITRNFHQNESFEEVEIEKEEMKFLYHNKDQYWFCHPADPAKRFFLAEEVVGAQGQFFKPNAVVTAQKFNDKIITVAGPIKADLLVKEAPPGVKGDTAQGGSKQVELETGATVSVPLFINTGDTIRINTQTGEYVERVEKV